MTEKTDGCAPVQPLFHTPKQNVREILVTARRIIHKFSIFFFTNML